jgi:putative ABC transport system permease protein
MYVPQAQLTDSFLTLVIRGGGEAGPLAAEARRAVWTVAKDVPVYEVAPLADLVKRSVGPRRFVMVLLEVFGAVALLMTAVGVYGVLSYSVAVRTREIGIREALGAAPGDIVRLVFGGGLAVVGGGLAAGLAIALAATRLLRGSLYGITATDPATLAAAALILFVVALLAHGVPLARAVAIDPAVALRQE